LCTPDTECVAWINGLLKSNIFQSNTSKNIKTNAK